MLSGMLLFVRHTLCGNIERAASTRASCAAIDVVRAFHSLATDAALAGKSSVHLLRGSGNLLRAQQRQAILPQMTGKRATLAPEHCKTGMAPT